MNELYGVAMHGQAGVVALPAERDAEAAQAEYFLAMLNHHRVAVCQRLEAHLDALARSQGTGDECARRRRRRVTEALESELRMIDRMRLALRVRLGLPTTDAALRTASMR
jgi:hypothetical protein